MESWLKFQAPGVSVSVGLGIGRLVFDALNKMEWLFAIVISYAFIMPTTKILSLHALPFLMSILIIVIQTFWLLPVMDARAELFIQGETVPASFFHFYYIGMETLKVICLTIFGITLFKK